MEIMNRVTRIVAGLVAIAVLAVMIAACGGGAANPLAGTKWQMQDYANPAVTTGMSTVLSGAIPTIEFGEDDAPSDDGVVSGSGGCNTYQGTYTVDGESLTFGPLAATEMACSDPEGVMEQEAVFLAQLQSAAAYRIDGEQLHILNEKGHLVILLNPQ
jgi:heat shock protein HslJ